MDWIVLLIKAVPAVVVMVVFIIYQWRCGRRVRLISAAIAKGLSGAGPAPGTAVAQPRFTWLKWVHDVYSENGHWLYSPPLPRAAAADALDNEIWHNAEYLKLQRLGMAAPLIGVILSGAGFMIFPVLERALGVRNTVVGAGTSPSDIMMQLSPLFLGVVVGAALALMNQWSTYHAATTLTDLRRTALRWFDREVWSAIAGRDNKDLDDAAESARSVAAKLSESCRILSEANTTYSDHLKSLGGQIQKVEESARFAADKFREQAASMTEMTTAVRDSISQLQDLGATADIVRETCKALERVTTSMDASAKNVESSSGNFRRVFTNFEVSIEDFSTKWNTSMEQALKTTTANLTTAADNLKAPVETFGTSIEKLSGNVNSQGDVVRALAEAGSDIRTFIHEQSKVANSAGMKVRNIENRAEELADAQDVLTDSIHKLGAACGDLHEQTQLIAEWDGATQALKTLAHAAERATTTLMVQGTRMAANEERLVSTVPLEDTMNKLYKVIDTLTQEMEIARRPHPNIFQRVFQRVKRWIPRWKRKKEEFGS